MTNEISVSAILIEEDGGYRALCPEVGIEVRGTDSDDTLEALKEAVAKKVREAGPDNIQLTPVKCMKFKIQVG